MAMTKPAAPPRLFNGIITNPVSNNLIASTASACIYDLKMMAYEIDMRLDVVRSQLNQIQQRTGAHPSPTGAHPLMGLTVGRHFPDNGIVNPLSNNGLQNLVYSDLVSVSWTLAQLSEHLEEVAGVVLGIDTATNPTARLQAASSSRNPGFLR
jgi:hypothetical protein